MREASLVAFTVLGQTAAGLTGSLAVVRWGVGPGAEAWLLGPLLAAAALMVAAGAASVLHLGSPGRAWRALWHPGTSWLSREVLLAGLLTGAVVATALMYGSGLGGPGLRAVVLAAAAAIGVGLVYAMARVYRLRTVPAWDSPLTPASFFLTAGVLGSLAAALALALVGLRGAPSGWAGPVRVLALVATAGAGLELVLEPVTRRHHRRARQLVDPGLWPTSHPGRWTTTGRPGLLVAVMLAGQAAAFMVVVGWGSIGMALVPFLLVLALAAAGVAEVLGRARFYRARSRVGV